MCIPDSAQPQAIGPSPNSCTVHMCTCVCMCSPPYEESDNSGHQPPHQHPPSRNISTIHLPAAQTLTHTSSAPIHPATHREASSAAQYTLPPPQPQAVSPLCPPLPPSSPCPPSWPLTHTPGTRHAAHHRTAAGAGKTASAACGTGGGCSGTHCGVCMCVCVVFWGREGS